MGKDGDTVFPRLFRCDFGDGPMEEERFRTSGSLLILVMNALKESH